MNIYNYGNIYPINPFVYGTKIEALVAQRRSANVAVVDSIRENELFSFPLTGKKT